MTRSIELRNDFELPREQVVALYKANHWSSAGKPDELCNALRNSHSLISAWEGDQLVGLGNALSDGHLVVYYPHLLVLPTHQGLGIGGKILAKLKERYVGFHQHILVADGRSIDFYAKNGFAKAGATQSMWIYAGDDH